MTVAITTRTTTGSEAINTEKSGVTTVAAIAAVKAQGYATSTADRTRTRATGYTRIKRGG